MSTETKRNADWWTFAGCKTVLGAVFLLAVILIARSAIDVVSPPTPQERCQDRGGLWLLPPSSDNGMCLAPGLFR